MGVHHVAYATADLDATHRFYTEVMGFSLVKTVSAPTPQGGWAKHLFYATAPVDSDGTAHPGSPGMIAFWDLHIPGLDTPKTAVSVDLGLPDWVNHLAFDAVDEDRFAAKRDAMVAAGLEVVELDHEFCRSAYAHDPNGILVEWCLDVRPFTDDEATQAELDRLADQPEFDNLPDLVSYSAATEAD